MFLFKVQRYSFFLNNFFFYLNYIIFYHEFSGTAIAAA